MAVVPLVQNFSLPGEICRKFALDWSADNKISICTSKAIYILTSYCSPVETGFPSPLHKQVIKIPDKPMKLSTFKYPPNPYKYIQSDEDRYNLFNVLMDHTLNPSPPERAEAFRAFRCCKWSPKGAATTSRCLLAALTMDHRLSLYEECEKEWRCLCDLTELMRELLVPSPPTRQQPNLPKRKRQQEQRPLRTRSKKTEEEEEKVEIEEEEGVFDIKRTCNYEKLMAETYRFAPMEITWTGMFGSAPTSINDKSYEFCFLIVAMKSGHIQFWKVSPSDGKMISLAHEWDTGLGMLTTISWQQTSSNAGFLMCGSHRGVLAFLPVGITVSGEQGGEPRVVVKNMCKVWDEEDRVAVDHIAILKIALRKYVVIAAKLHALVGCEILLTEDSIIIRNVGHSFGLHSLPITGMAVQDTRSMPQYKVLIATMEGDIVEIKVSLGNDEIKFQHEKLHIDLDLKNNMIQGLALSSNGLLCGLILNTSVYFDHLEKKEPLQFAMFVTKPYEEIYAKLKTVLKPQFSFLPTASNTVSNHTDYLECIRVNLACGTPLPDWLTAFMDNDPGTYENCSTMELYFMRFLIHAYVSGLAISAPKVKGEFEVRLYAVEAMIMRNYILRVFSRCQDSLDLLSPGQAQSLLLMADWLLREYRMPVEGLYSALGCDTPTDPDDLPARETCDICKGEVRLDNIKVGQCSRNHQFARCCQSLLLCDVVPYNRCPCCKSIALKDLWNIDLHCTYCGITMV